MKDKNNQLRQPVDSGKNLAEFIKEKRQSKNISLERLSELTKIQVYHLESLESGQFDKLPPLVYRAGIFRRLSKFLNVDENEIMESYKNELDFSDTKSTSNNIPILRKRSYFIITPSKLIFFLGALLFLSFSIYLGYQLNFLVGLPNLAIDPKEDLITKDGAILVNGKTDSGVNLTINGENVYVASNGIFSKEVKLADGINIIEVMVVNSFGKTTKIIRQIFKEIPIIN